jgi:small multidrug resistance pump
MAYLHLSIAIFSEIIATSFLKASDGFTKGIPTLISLVGYCITFYFLSLALRTLSLGVAYATWSGVGIASLAVIGYFLYGQKLDIMAVIGIAFIVIGILIINIFSKSVSH